MATGKRYYWIKLKDSFMNSEVVDFLMSQPNGASYVVLYQMLCLKTINTDGRLTCQIGDIIVPFDIGKIQRDCKYFTLDTIRVALGLYKQLGLIYEEQDGTLVLVNHAEMVGSETDYSAQKRMQRENRRRQIPVQCADSVEDNAVDIVHTDIRDKRIEIRDKDIRDRDNDSRGSLAADPGLAEIIQSFEDNIGSFPLRTTSAAFLRRRKNPCSNGGRYSRMTSSCWLSKRLHWPGFASGTTSTAS